MVLICGSGGSAALRVSNEKGTRPLMASSSSSESGSSPRLPISLPSPMTKGAPATPPRRNRAIAVPERTETW